MEDNLPMYRPIASAPNAAGEATEISPEFTIIRLSDGLKMTCRSCRFGTHWPWISNATGEVNPYLNRVETEGGSCNDTLLSVADRLALESIFTNNAQLMQMMANTADYLDFRPGTRAHTEAQMQRHLRSLQTSLQVVSLFADTEPSPTTLKSLQDARDFKAPRFFALNFSSDRLFLRAQELWEVTTSGQSEIQKTWEIAFSKLASFQPSLNVSRPELQATSHCSDDIGCEYARCNTCDVIRCMNGCTPSYSRLANHAHKLRELRQKYRVAELTWEMVVDDAKIWKSMACPLRFSASVTETSCNMLDNTIVGAQEAPVGIGSNAAYYGHGMGLLPSSQLDLSTGGSEGFWSLAGSEGTAAQYPDGFFQSPGNFSDNTLIDFVPKPFEDPLQQLRAPIAVHGTSHLPILPTAYSNFGTSFIPQTTDFHNAPYYNDGDPDAPTTVQGFDTGIAPTTLYPLECPDQRMVLGFNGLGIHLSTLQAAM